MICVSIQNRTYPEIVDILQGDGVEMAEIRLDLCPLGDDEITELFENSDTPLLASCPSAAIKAANPDMRPWEADLEAERRLSLAVKAGARFADLDVAASATISKRFQKLCHSNGTELIRSYHNFEETPDSGLLADIIARCFRYGAAIAKIAVTARTEEDCERVAQLYAGEQERGTLIAFCMGDEGQESRFDSIRLGAPFLYAALGDDEKTAPGQPTLRQARERIYGDLCPYVRNGLKMPASKSFAQRAIIAAALAEGVSRLEGYTPCGDSESAIEAARALGAEVEKGKGCLTIKGAGPVKLNLDSIQAGESGLLARLLIPLCSVLNENPIVVEGRGTLLSRPLHGAGDIMAAFGVMLTNAEKRVDRELHVPVKVKGHVIPGTADIPGEGGSQLISGLLMALPLCSKDSCVYVSEPKSIPYMYITLDVLRHFGISTRSEMEGNAEMLQAQDWSYCSGINFQIRGSQSYRAADFAIEGDWSAAANYMVAGAIFGKVEICGLDTSSLQADLGITDILVDAGASVSQTEDNVICVRKAPLEHFSADLNHAPDLFPIVALLAAFCSGTSRIAGAGRLSSKESDRAAAILEMLEKFGVRAGVEEDTMWIEGETLASRISNGRLLKGGGYSSHHDHRLVMALKVAALGAESPVIIDDEACVAKSFPDFSL